MDVKISEDLYKIMCFSNNFLILICIYIFSNPC